MNKKQMKEIKKGILAESMKSDKSEYNSNFVKVEYNEKGKFYFATITVDLNVKTSKGEVVVQKDFMVNINIDNDVAIDSKVLEQINAKEESELAKSRADKDAKKKADKDAKAKTKAEADAKKPAKKTTSAKSTALKEISTAGIKVTPILTATIDQFFEGKNPDMTSDLLDKMGEQGAIVRKVLSSHRKSIKA